MTFPALLDIEVTESDIATGERQHVCHCPIAIAACRALDIARSKEEVNVESTIDIWIADLEDEDGVVRGGWVRYEFPTTINDWIEDFDHRVPVEPIAFTATRIGDFF